DLVEQAAAEKEAALVALQFEPAAIDGELRAFLDAELDIGAHPVEVLAGDERAPFRLRVSARANLLRLHPRHQLVPPPVPDPPRRRPRPRPPCSARRPLHRPPPSARRSPGRDRRPASPPCGFWRRPAPGPAFLRPPPSYRCTRRSRSSRQS